MVIYIPIVGLVGNNKQQRTKASKIRYQKPEIKAKESENKKRYRSNPDKRATIIARDSKGSDKRYNRVYNLSLDLIKILINNECFYCGETELLMTLDRIDNNLGHVECNVNPACIRCNLMKKDMPYKAWMCIVPAIKIARELKLFENWTGKIHK